MTTERMENLSPKQEIADHVISEIVTANSQIEAFKPGGNEIYDLTSKRLFTRRVASDEAIRFTAYSRTETEARLIDAIVDDRLALSKVPGMIIRASRAGREELLAEQAEATVEIKEVEATHLEKAVMAFNGAIDQKIIKATALGKSTIEDDKRMDIVSAKLGLTESTEIVKFNNGKHRKATITYSPDERTPFDLGSLSEFARERIVSESLNGSEALDLVVLKEELLIFPGYETGTKIERSLTVGLNLNEEDRRKSAKANIYPFAVRMDTTPEDLERITAIVTDQQPIE